MPAAKTALAVLPKPDARPVVRRSSSAAASRTSAWSRVVAADIVAIGDFAAMALGALPPALLVRVPDGVPGVAVLHASFIAGLIALFCLRKRGMYDTSRMTKFPYAPSELTIAVFCAIAGVVALSVPVVANQAHLAPWCAAWASASLALLVLNRLAARLVLARFSSDGRFDQRVAMFGAGETASRLHDVIAADDLGVRFFGLFDDRPAERVDSLGMPIVGKLADLIEECRAGRIDRVIIALPKSADARLADVLARLESLPVSTHVVTHFTSDLVDFEDCPDVSALGPIGLLDVKRKRQLDWSPFAKRVEDVVLAGAILAATAPLWLAIALAIKLDSPGPVLFRQRRRGRFQSEFDVFKFRTMSVLEDGDDVRQAREDDDRVTCVGRNLRASSLDELPQLLNVLKGDMSIVGPRPHAMRHDAKFSRALERYADRHQMRPGMTGLAQVSGLRGPTTATGAIEARVDADMTYIANWSIWLDIKIIVRTFAAVWKGDNAC